MDHPRDPAPRTSESRSAGATLLCTVRGCGRPLAPEAGTLRCALGHAFDRARRGWVNLLQPQDRRSRAPGDSRDAALARRRLVTAGLEAPLHDRLVAALDSPRAGGTRGEALPVLDVGCGEGSVLAALAARRSIVAHGVDLSADAVDLAAAALPAGVWVVANADRGLPFADGSFDLALSLLARRPADELARVLRRTGTLLVAVPGPADLAELRREVQGEANPRERLDAVRAELAGEFELVRHERLAWTIELDRTGLADLLASSYRGARHRERERFASIERLAVTCERDLLWFTPRAAGR